MKPNSAEKSRLFLFDAMALAYRAHFAMANSRLRNADGLATGPVFGFANTLVKLLDTEKPTHAAVVWDTHVPTFRHEMDPAYKANRPPQPEELREAIPHIKTMIEAFGIKNLEKDGFEADDIIGTLAKQAEAAEADVFLVTPDKDFMQLVDDHITMLKPLNNGDGFDRIGREGVQAYFGVAPERVIDVLALIGDTSDNVPGVPGIGKKGAPQLIQEYGDLSNLLKSAEHIKAKRVREGLLTGAEQAEKSKILVTINTDVPDTCSWKELAWNGPKSADLAQFFRKMGFRTLSARYSGSTPTPVNQAQGDLFGSTEPVEESEVSSEFSSYDATAVTYRSITQIDALKEAAASLENVKVLCFDTETTGTEPMTSELVGISLSHTPGEAWYIALGNDSEVQIEDIQRELGDIFGDKTILKVAHNHKYDYQMLTRYGVPVRGPIFDTMLAAYLIDGSQPLKMDALAEKYLRYTPIPIQSLIGKNAPWQHMGQVPVDTISPYACEDADITLQLYLELTKQLQKDGLEEVARTIEFPLSEVLADMEMHGVRIDNEMLSWFGAELLNEIQQLEASIYEASGAQFNLNSPAQLGEVLFNKLNIPTGKKTSTGKFSTNEEVLKTLALTHEVPRLVLEYRGLAKLKSTYVDALPQLILAETGRVHTSYNQSVAATGRLSSSGPNLQNIPIRTPRGREIRRAFIAGDGFKLMSADYSQVELRIIAAIADDVAMKEAFERGEDIHARTAASIFGIDISEVTPDQRRKAKEVNFGIPYGVSAFGLAQRLGISNIEGRDMIDAYFDRFPKIRNYISETVAYAKEHGYVRTLSGRRRYIPDINSRNPTARGFAERTAINMPIQGTAADIIKIAMIQIHKLLRSDVYKSRMILQVHDELVFEIHETEKDILPIKIIGCMENAMDIGVPLHVESGIADNWLAAH